MLLKIPACPCTQQPAPGHAQVLTGQQAACLQRPIHRVLQGIRQRAYLSAQAIYSAGAFHPTVAQDIEDALAQSFSPQDYPPPLLWLEGFRCGCLAFYTDPCRVQFRKARARTACKHACLLCTAPRPRAARQGDRQLCELRRRICELTWRKSVSFLHLSSVFKNLKSDMRGA